MATVLREMETRHGFRAGPREVPILTDVVSANSFLRAIEQGRPMKDVGVSLDHGEYTHRIQWYIIMVDYEEHRGAYNHRPLDLYKRIFALGPCSVPKGNKGNMWDCLFDRAEYDDYGEHPEIPAETYFGDRAPYHSHFTCPENLNRFLCDPARGGVAVPSLHRVVTYRQGKRAQQVQNAGGFAQFRTAYVQKLNTSGRHDPAGALEDVNKLFWKR